MEAATQTQQEAANRGERRDRRGGPGRGRGGVLHGPPARDLQRPRGGVRRRQGTRPARARGAAAPRRRARPHGGDGRDRRARARHPREGHRRSDHRPRGRRDAGPDLQPARRPDRRRRRHRGRGALADPPARAERGGPHPDARDPRDRHQGRGPAGALREGRQGRPVRRRRRGQDGAHPGADPQHRPGARRPVRVLRRGRALPRGQRPLGRDDRVGRDRQDHARVRPDERAARRPYARRAVRPDDGGVLPRAGRPGRAALHRQHLPVRAGRLRGVRAPRPHALAGGLPAHPRDRRWASSRSGSPRPARAR